MKTLLTLFVLLFSSSVLAEDISDFQIEGMSIGDSLLDYFSEEEILNNKEDFIYKNNNFYQIGFYSHASRFKTYDALQVNLKTNDKNYIIYSIIGGIFFEDNINDCFQQKDEIVNELKIMFNTAKITDYGTYDHPDDETGESKVTSVYFDLKFGDVVRVACLDWSKNSNWTDHLRINIDKKEYDYWINNEAY